MIAYKLFRLRKDGTLGPLFINRRQKLIVGETYAAESHQTVGYAFRPGWHACSQMVAPHLSKKGRVWAIVDIDDYCEHHRPESQGGLWYVANTMTIVTITGT